VNSQGDTAQFPALHCGSNFLPDETKAEASTGCVCEDFCKTGRKNYKRDGCFNRQIQIVQCCPDFMAASIIWKRLNLLLLRPLRQSREAHR
jgi:hypothetical protein